MHGTSNRKESWHFSTFLVSGETKRKVPDNSFGFCDARKPFSHVFGAQRRGFFHMFLRRAAPETFLHMFFRRAAPESPMCSLVFAVVLSTFFCFSEHFLLLFGRRHFFEIILLVLTKNAALFFWLLDGKFSSPLQPFPGKSGAFGECGFGCVPGAARVNRLQPVCTECSPTW